jgi:hypothetical protein
MLPSSFLRGISPSLSMPCHSWLTDSGSGQRYPKNTSPHRCCVTPLPCAICKQAEIRRHYVRSLVSQGWSQSSGTSNSVSGRSSKNRSRSQQKSIGPRQWPLHEKAPTVGGNPLQRQHGASSRRGTGLIGQGRRSHSPMQERIHEWRCFWRIWQDISMVSHNATGTHCFMRDLTRTCKRSMPTGCFKIGSKPTEIVLQMQKREREKSTRILPTGKISHGTMRRIWVSVGLAGSCLSCSQAESWWPGSTTKRASRAV